MKHACIVAVAMMSVLHFTGEAAAQDEYGPEEIGAEESPIVDPDIGTDESGDELEEVDAMDGVQDTAPAEASEGRGEGRGCAVGSFSSLPPGTPLGALLLGLGLIALRLRSRK